MFVKRNPQTPRNQAETAGRLLAALGVAAAKLTVEQQRELVAHKDKLPDIIAIVLAKLKAREERAGDGGGLAGSHVEESVGQRLGEQLEGAEASRRLKAYATPIRVEDWAGRVVGPGEIERTYGIPRSTLHDWQKQHAVVGLLSGVKKHVFPVAQFVDGRPVEGLARIVNAAESPRTAWLWLIEPHPSLRGKAPLDQLKAGNLSTVADLAERDFGQS
jgi:hypothetical protein